MQKEWTIKEDNLLLYEIRHNISIDIVKKYHNRDANDIRQRIVKIAERMVENDIEFNTIIKLTKLNQSLVLNLFCKQQNFHNNCRKYIMTEIKRDLNLIKKHLKIQS
jgi:hypothetical protein